jgi:hypothetical protein
VAERDELAVAQREIVRRVVEYVVAAPLRFEQQGEGGIALYLFSVDLLYVVV